MSVEDDIMALAAYIKAQPTYGVPHKLEFICHPDDLEWLKALASPPKPEKPPKSDGL